LLNIFDLSLSPFSSILLSLEKDIGAVKLIKEVDFVLPLRKALDTLEP
jgi:hypothetical protein